jgi:hypothetical protein
VDLLGLTALPMRLHRGCGFGYMKRPSCSCVERMSVMGSACL